jgi:TonB family protein
MIKWMFFAAAAATTPAAAAPFQPASEARAGTPPRLIQGSISNADYPSAAVAASQQGTTAMKIMVGADGSVTGCSVEATSGSQELDTTSCALATSRFRFAPARDASGGAIPSIYRTRVSWRLQDSSPGMPARAPFQSFWAIYTAQIQGTVVRSCSQHSLGMPAGPADVEICTRMFDSVLIWAGQRGGVRSLTQSALEVDLVVMRRRYDHFHALGQERPEARA